MMNLANGGFENGGRAQSGGRTLRNLLRIAFALFIWVDAGGAAQGQRVDVPMVSDRWQQVFGHAEFKQHNGAEALVMIAEGAAKPNAITFRNGTIEFDVDPIAMGAGLGFHMRDNDTFEMLYFRPQANCASAPDCLQYAPFTRKVLLWDLFPQYQAPAPLRQNEWNHVKVVISGQRMNVFVNGAASPTLAVGRLEGDASEGGLALIGPGAFAHLTVTPDSVEGLTPDPAADPTAADGRFVRHWQIAPSSPLADGSERSCRICQSHRRRGAPWPPSATAWSTSAASTDCLPRGRPAH